MDTISTVAPLELSRLAVSLTTDATASSHNSNPSVNKAIFFPDTSLFNYQINTLYNIVYTLLKCIHHIVMIIVTVSITVHQKPITETHNLLWVSAYMLCVISETHLLWVSGYINWKWYQELPTSSKYLGTSHWSGTRLCRTSSPPSSPAIACIRIYIRRPFDGKRETQYLNTNAWFTLPRFTKKCPKQILKIGPRVLQLTE